VGGYEYNDRGGESLRMWFDYLPNSKIIGIDLYEKKDIINERTEFWQGSQTDKHLLKVILSRCADADKRIVIDDASHNNRLTIETFSIIFPLLKGGDLYFVEDVHTSYFDDKLYEGSEKPGDTNTTMEFFTRLTHQLNGEHLKMEHQNQYSWMVEWIHFYKEIIVVKRL
jgi:cephalosporin hydroxylase